MISPLTVRFPSNAVSLNLKGTSISFCGSKKIPSLSWVIGRFSSDPAKNIFEKDKFSFSSNLIINSGLAEILMPLRTTILIFINPSFPCLMERGETEHSTFRKSSWQKTLPNSKNKLISNSAPFLIIIPISIVLYFQPTVNRQTPGAQAESKSEKTGLGHFIVQNITDGYRQEMRLQGFFEHFPYLLCLARIP